MGWCEKGDKKTIRNHAKGRSDGVALSWGGGDGGGGERELYRLIGMYVYINPCKFIQQNRRRICT